MKKKTINNFIGFLVGFLAIPILVMAQTITPPSLEVVGINFIERTSATAIVNFNHPHMEQFSLMERPTVLAEFTNTQTGYSTASAYAQPYTNTQTYYFRVDGLEPGAEYRVTAVMRYQGITYVSQPKLMKTRPNPSSSSSSHSSNNQGNQNNQSVSPDPIINVPTIGSLFRGTSTAKTTVQQKVMTGGITNKDGVGIAITNEQARVDARDTFTYTVRYQNGRTTSLRNAQIVIELPANYEFVRSSADLEYRPKTNTVHMSLGRIPAGTSKSFTFTARALDGQNGEMRTDATLFYEGGKVTATDRDSFYGGSKSALGASVFGAGFFPQTLFGWIILILLIALIIIVARRYTTQPVEKKIEHQEQKPA